MNRNIWTIDYPSPSVFEQASLMQVHRNLRGNWLNFSKTEILCNAVHAAIIIMHNCTLGLKNITILVCAILSYKSFYCHNL